MEHHEIDLVYGALALVAIFSIMARKGRAQWKKGFVMAALWLVVLALVFTGVVYWPEVKNSKLYASLDAGSQVTNADGSMEFYRASDGHFHITAKINDQNIEFLVDTGAASITLTQKDAAKAGFYPGELNYNKLYSTANGYTRGAAVELKNLEIGKYQTGPIAASVNEGQLEMSLLGMVFLDKMKSYKIEGDKLVLIP